MLYLYEKDSLMTEIRTYSKKQMASITKYLATSKTTQMKSF